MMARVAAGWERYWFEPSSPVDLGIARSLFYLGVLLGYAADRPDAWGSVDRLYWMPIPSFEWLHLTPASPSVLGVLHRVWQLSLLLSALGLFGRFSMGVAAALGFYLLGLPHNFGHTFHFDATLVLAMIVLAFSRATDAYSLDQRLANRASPRHVPPSGEYTWPIRLIWMLVAVVFFAAGVSKLRHGGMEWVFSSNMSLVLTKALYHVSDADPLTTIGLWIARHEWLSRMLAAFALLTELGFCLAPFSRRARIVLVPLSIALLLGIRTLMGPTFGGFLVVNVFWVPWQRVAETLAGFVPAAHRSVSAPRAGGYVDASRATEERLT
jgi:hypothetical protein